MNLGFLGPTIVGGRESFSPRERVVLSVLAIHRADVVTPDQIADALWGDSPPSTWPKQVQASVGRLRKVLGSWAIETSSSGYRLALDAEHVDVCQFEALVSRARVLGGAGEADRAAATYARALGLWRGRPFDDLNGWNAAYLAAARLEEIRRTAEEEMLKAQLDAGDHRAVAAAAETLASAEPLREKRWAVLALAQYRCGRQADALRTLQRARRLLADELGISPGRELAQLEYAILNQDAQLTPVAVPPRVSIDCPYKGLAVYESADEEWFFGRDEQVAICIDRLQTVRLLVVTGPSGCGKSSFLRAGLTAALIRLGHPVCVVVPDDDPVAQVAMAVASEQNAVLVMDQVEMIASLEQNHDVTIAFGAAIAAYATDVAPVILGVRADHLALLAADDTLRSMTESGLHFLPTLGGDDLRAAIEGPAERSGLRVESGLIELLLRDAEGQPGALPLVSHALVETWRRRDGGTLTVEAYQSSGGIRSAVARSADRLYDNLTTGEQGALRSLVLRLVASAPGGEVVRCRVPTNLIRGTSDRDHVLDLLVRARLITLEEETAELAHEALVRAWPRLRGWLDDDVAGQQVLWRLANAAGEWASTGRVDSDLYRGARLASAIEYCHGTAHDLSSIETEFLAASKQLAQSEIRAAEERTRQEAETNRRLRRSLIGIGALLAIALVAGSVALINWRAASEQRDAAQAAEDEAGIESLVNRSLALRSTNRDVAALLAVEAASQWPDDPRSLSALLGTFTGAGGFLGNRYLDGFDHLVGAMIPHTTSAVIAGEPDGLAVLDLESGALDRRFAAAVAGDSWWTVSLEVSDDGRFVVEELRVGENRCFDIEQIRAGSGGGCAALVVYDVPSGQTITGPITLPVVPDSIAIADDGALLAVNDANTGDLLLYRSTDGAQAGSVAGLPIPIDSNTVDAVAAVAFGPDGNVYVGSVAGPIRRVDPSDASVVAVYDAPAFSSNQHLSVGTDGLIVAGGNHALVAIDESDGRVVWEVSLLGTHPNPCPWFAASEAADRVYCGNLFGVVNERVRSTGQRTATSLDAQLGSVGRLSITDDGKELIAFGDAVPAISRWRLDGGGPVTSRVATGYIAGDGFDPGGTTLVVAARDQGATVDTDFSDFELWDVDEDRALESFDFDAVGVGWSGSHAVVGYLPEENVVAWYDVDSGIRIAASDIPADCEHSWMSAGGALTYCGFPDGTVWTIDGETGHRIAPTFHVASMPTAVSATRAGETVVITAFDEDGPVTTFYSGATGEALGDDLRGPWITAVSLDGVLVGASNGTVVRYDMETREPTATLAGARGEVNTLQFSDDGAVLVATALDQTVSIYDVASGIRLGDPIPSDAPFVFPGFLRPDGRAVAVTDQRGIAIWSLDRSTLIDAACKMAGRELTAIEWDTYLLSVPQRALCS